MARPPGSAVQVVPAVVTGAGNRRVDWPAAKVQGAGLMIPQPLPVYQ